MNGWHPISLCTVVLGLSAALAPAAEGPAMATAETPNVVWKPAAVIGAPVKASGASAAATEQVKREVVIEASADAASSGTAESPILAPDAIKIESPEFAPADPPTAALPDMPLETPAYGRISTRNSLTGDLFSALGSLGGGTFSSRDSNFWFTGDYLFSFVRAAAYPALATTSPPGTSHATAGVLGQPGTSTLFGNKLDDNVRPGFQIGTGYWVDAQHSFGVELGFMMLSNQSSLFFANSAGTPILARPFNDTASGLPQAVLVAFPGSSGGALDFRAYSGPFYGGNIDFAEKIYDSGRVRFNALAGYQAYGYTEGLYVNQTITPSGGGFSPGTRITSIDNIGTQNLFHGMDLGMRTEFFWSSFGLELLTKVAIGNLHTTVSAVGTQTTTAPGSPTAAFPGGVLALPSNMGSFSANYLAAVPNFGLTLKWQVMPNLQFRAGYSLLWINGAARAGSEVNTTINTNNFPPATNVVPFSQPTYILQRSDLWIQNINVGLTWTY